jgi:hypothetical protein
MAMKFSPKYHLVGKIQTIKRFAFWPVKIWREDKFDQYYWIWLEFYYKDYYYQKYPDGIIRRILNKDPYQK